MASDRPGVLALSRLAVPAVGVLIAATAAVLPGAARANVIGPDYVASDHVQWIAHLPLASDGVGGRIVGNYLYVTSTKDFEIYDISTPANPIMVGSYNVDVEFENEQVPTNGKILGLSGQTGAITPNHLCPPGSVSPTVGCLAIFDVRDKAHPAELAIVPNAGDHTSTCILDCTYMYGSAGDVTDLTRVLDPGHVATKLSFNWIAYLKSRGYPFYASCHHQNEIRPGILLTACDPMYLLSVLPQDGGSVTAPVVLGEADYLKAPDDQKRFVHSGEWPQHGFDRIMLSGGETNFTPTCGSLNGAFSTFLVGGTPQAPTFTWADQVRPVGGDYLDGNPPNGTFHLGCSVHWFEANPSFNNQGLVALASYENGTRFEQICPNGKIIERGFFEPLLGATSAPHWAADGRTLYAIDYQRGIDVLRWNGPLYIDGAPDCPGSPASSGTAAQEAVSSPVTAGSPSALPFTGGPVHRSPIATLIGAVRRVLGF